MMRSERLPWLTFPLLVGCLINRDLYEDRKDLLIDHDQDGYNEVDGDCNDADPDIGPGAAEVCNGLDDDCNDIIDDDPTDAGPWYFDEDGDGFGEPSSAASLCDSPGEGWGLVGGDCDDTAASVSPDAVEVCNLVDDDCDGVVDDDPVDAAVWYPDEDSDGYGDLFSPQLTCEDVTGLLTTGEDCDDSDAAVNPDAEEICNDRIDNDCDGLPGDCLWETAIDMQWAITIDSSTAWDTFAFDGAIGDLDADGEDELLLGSHYVWLEERGERPGTIQVFELPITASMSRADADHFYAGENDEDAFGKTFDVGDLDGDGYEDLLTGAWASDPNGVSMAGRTMVFYGPITGDIDAGEADWVIEGTTESNSFGEMVTFLGDFNGDDALDFSSGSSFASHDGGTFAGTVRVYLPAGSGVETESEQASLTVHGTRNNAALNRCATGTDVNVDGVADLLLCSEGGEDLYGAIYVFEGGHTGTVTSDDADLTWEGESYLSATGNSVGSPGDLDGDGADDVLIGATQAGDGAAYVLWGRSDLSSMSLADADITIRGTLGDKRNFGGLVRGIGDLNEDGDPDILVAEGGGAPNDVYVYYGPFPASAVLEDLDADIVLTGDPEEDEDYNLAIGGEDLTGDGVPDLLIGSHQNDVPAGDEVEWGGMAYIIPGVGL